MFGRAIAIVGVLTAVGGGYLIHLGGIFEVFFGIVVVFVGAVVFLVGILLVLANKWPWAAPDPGRRGRLRSGHKSP